MSDPVLPPIVDATMLTCARSCMQRFYNEFVLGLRPAHISIDLHAGGVTASTIEAVHRGVWEQGLPFDDALARGHGVFIREWGDFPTSDDDLKTPARMWEAIEEYFHLYPPLMDHCQPYWVNGKATSEFSFAIPLDLPGWPLHPVSGDPFIYTGRADMLGTYKGRPCIRDEKTGSKLDRNWSEKWDLRAQFQGYCWAAQHGGIDCDTVIVRGIIPYKKQIPRCPEAIKFYPRWQIDRWFETTRRTLCQIVQAWKEGYWEYNLGDSCTQFGSCSFMSLCTIPEEQRENWRSNYAVRRWNPLDRNPIKSAEPVPSGSEKLMEALQESVRILSDEHSPPAA